MESKLEGDLGSMGRKDEWAAGGEQVEIELETFTHELDRGSSRDMTWVAYRWKRAHRHSPL